MASIAIDLDATWTCLATPAMSREISTALAALPIKITTYENMTSLRVGSALLIKTCFCLTCTIRIPDILRALTLMLPKEE